MRDYVGVWAQRSFHLGDRHRSAGGGAGEPEPVRSGGEVGLAQGCGAGGLSYLRQIRVRFWRWHEE